MAVKLNEAAIAEVLYGPQGPVMRHVYRTATAIKEIAAGLVNTSAEEHADGSPHLADTGVLRPLPHGVDVVFTAAYAAAYHNGARPHEIVARNARVLAFNWPKAGGMVFFPRVNHPGNAAHPFLAEAAAAVGSAPLI